MKLLLLLIPTYGYGDTTSLSKKLNRSVTSPLFAVSILFGYIFISVSPKLLKPLSTTDVVAYELTVPGAGGYSSKSISPIGFLIKYYILVNWISYLSFN